MTTVCGAEEKLSILYFYDYPPSKVSNMNYELAKQLKEAGFPQPNPLEEGKHFAYGPTIDGGATGLSTSDMAPFYCPTLEELIDACGEFDLKIRKESTEARKLHTGLLKIKGAIPVEAVANLWLALNKK